MKRSDDVYVAPSADEEASAKNISSLDLYCLILSLSLRYFRSTTYICMFNEAYYLYQLIKRVFDAPSVTPLIVIAYVIPALITATYIGARSLLPIVTSDTSPRSLVSPPPAPPSFTFQLPSSLQPDTSTYESIDTSLYTSTSAANQTIVHSVPASVAATVAKVSVEDDACWMLPARDSWKEWIINGPNLAILLVS